MITLLTTQEIRIKTPIEVVFDFISNMENFKYWFPEVSDIISENDLEHGAVGKTYLELVNLPPNGEQKLKIEVKQVKTPILFITESEYVPLLPRMTIRLNQINDHETDTSWSMHSRNDDTKFVTETLPNFKSLISDRAEIGLKKLKKLLENK